MRPLSRCASVLSSESRVNKGRQVANSKTVDAFLAGYPESVQDTAQAARRFVRSVLPDVNETVDESAKLIGYAYGEGYKGVVCTLILSRNGVKLGVMHGAELPDPTGLLTGTGKVHRYVPLQSGADLARPGLKLLLENALAACRARNASRISARRRR